MALGQNILKLQEISEEIAIRYLKRRRKFT